MFRAIRTWQAAMADYTIGTVIVMVHMATADRKDRLALPGNR